MFCIKTNYFRQIMNKIPIPTIFILTFAMLILAPMTGDAGSKSFPKAPWSVHYEDGSANGYRFHRDSESDDAHFQYSPVQPKDSSTGMYSGGEPANGVMKPKQVEELWKRILKLESDAKLRAEARIKGTGAFHIKESTLNRDFIIVAGPELDSWNKFLSAFRRGKQGLISPRIE